MVLLCYANIITFHLMSLHCANVITFCLMSLHHVNKGILHYDVIVID